MLQYVVVPTCRSTAEAVQILFSHAFGDAGSPYLIGPVIIILLSTATCRSKAEAVQILSSHGGIL